jgi:hypothetical protein
VREEAAVGEAGGEDALLVDAGLLLDDRDDLAREVPALKLLSIPAGRTAIQPRALMLAAIFVVRSSWSGVPPQPWKASTNAAGFGASSDASRGG